jgi:hypothetical protein
LFAGSVLAAGISGGFADAAVPAITRIQLVVLVPYATVIPQFVAYLWCRAGGAGVAAVDMAEEVSIGKWVLVEDAECGRCRVRYPVRFPRESAIMEAVMTEW